MISSWRNEGILWHLMASKWAEKAPRRLKLKKETSEVWTNEFADGRERPAVLVFWQRMCQYKTKASKTKKTTQTSHVRAVSTARGASNNTAQSKQPFSFLFCHLTFVGNEKPPCDERVGFILPTNQKKTPKQTCSIAFPPGEWREWPFQKSREIPGR